MARHVLLLKVCKHLFIFYKMLFSYCRYTDTTNRRFDRLRYGNSQLNIKLSNNSEDIKTTIAKKKKKTFNPFLNEELKIYRVI